MADVLGITFDHAQQRLKARSTRIALLGEELFDERFTGAGNLFMLPGANCLCLKPYQMDAEYDTSNSGNYAKLTIGGGLEVLTSGSWKPHEDFNGAGNFYACDAPGAGEYIRTSAKVGLNRPVVLSVHAYDAGDKYKIADFGYADTAIDPDDSGVGLGFVLWSDGTLEVWKGGSWYADLKGLQIDKNHLNRIFIFPCRRRELVVFTAAYQRGTVVPSGVARYTFEDIDEGEAEPVISPHAKFFVRPGGGGTGSLKVQFQPLTFPTAGTSLSRTWSFGDAPREGSTLGDRYFTYWDSAYATRTDPPYTGDTYTDTSAATFLDIRTTVNGAFTPDGVISQVKARCQLTGDGLYTPFLYGVVAWYPADTRNTNGGAEFEARDWWTKCDLNVPDEPFGARASVEMLVAREYVEEETDQTELLTSRMHEPFTMSWRPVKLERGSAHVLDAVLRRPRLIDSIRDETKRFQFEAQTIFRMLEKHLAVTRMPFDGWLLCHPESRCAVRHVIEEAGIGCDLVLSDFNYTIGQVPHESCSEWNVAWEVGESALQMLDKLFRLASDGFMGERPAVDYPEFHFRTKEDMDAEAPKLTLYRSVADAMAAEPSLTESEAAELLYDGFREETGEIEAGEVRATGLDPRTGAILQSVARNDALTDPEVAPSAREPGWCGFPLTAGVSSRTFRQQEDCDKAVTALLPVATQQLTVGEFNANTLLLTIDGRPLWRGDKVTLDGIGDRQISSFHCSFDKEVPDDNGRLSDGYYSRRATYTIGAPLGKGGTSMQDIQAQQEIRSFEAFVNDLRRAPLEATGIIAVQSVALP